MSDVPRALHAEHRRTRANRAAPRRVAGTNLSAGGQRMPRVPQHRLPRTYGDPGADDDGRRGPIAGDAEGRRGDHPAHLHRARDDALAAKRRGTDSFGRDHRRRAVARHPGRYSLLGRPVTPSFTSDACFRLSRIGRQWPLGSRRRRRGQRAYGARQTARARNLSHATGGGRGGGAQAQLARLLSVLRPAASRRPSFPCSRAN